MRAIRDGDPDAGLVVAAQRGDRDALAALAAQYLPLLYNIVGRSLNGHADTDDVVQETMLRAVRGIGDLRDPAAFRSWLVAVAVRQVRDHAASLRMRLTGDAPPDVADPGADFVDLTILRMGLSGQRRETAEATRWLDDDDQELLALWWQEAAGTLERGEVAAGLGMTPAHAAVRISRMKERLTTARLVVRALRARPRCGALADMTAGWDQSPSPLWRKRVARHARDCPACGPLLADLIPAEHLLSGLPLLPLSVALASAARIPPTSPPPRPPAAQHPAGGHRAAHGHGTAVHHAGRSRRGRATTRSPTTGRRGHPGRWPGTCACCRRRWPASSPRSPWPSSPPPRAWPAGPWRWPGPPRPRRCPCGPRRHPGPPGPLRRPRPGPCRRLRRPRPPIRRPPIPPHRRRRRRPGWPRGSVPGVSAG